MAEVTLNSVWKSFGSVRVLEDLDLVVPAGSFTVLVGPSGCGKSTILRLIAGLEDGTSGEIRIGGVDVTTKEPSQRGIAMVFQSYALYPHMSVAENIGFGLTLARLPKAEIRKRVEEAARILQLENLLDRKPRHLSGGQRQRVAIGRAITRNPKVFLFDEPLSNLDAALRTQMRVELAELHAKIGATMIYVTHDQVEAMTMADRIIVLNEGRIEQVGSPMELYNRPETAFVAGFIGAPKMNLISGESASRRGCDLLGIRPEHVEVCQTGGEWEGRLRYVEHLGSDTIAYVDVAGVGPMTVRMPGEFNLNSGDLVQLNPQKAHEHLFRASRRIETEL